ncbi:hypothetical protein V7150_16225 [Neobacillus drentensis]|uniref:hypothetical protein n=1 Tax=Neobacillus drentensis TaxID=220684 RepID=UPI002FFF81EF
MEISVNEQPQQFYLAFDKWRSAVGHQIKVGKYSFCAIPLSECINVSEVTSGVKVIAIPMNVEILMLTESKEGSIKFFNKIGESLKRIIGSTDNFESQLEEMRKTAFERLGKMPPIENVDIDMIMVNINDVLN